MSIGELQSYLFADRLFFETLSRWSRSGPFTIASRPLPRGWRREDRGIWTTLYPPDVALPMQGWKIHVAGHVGTAEAVSEVVWDYCVANRLAFKYLATPDLLFGQNAKYAHRAASGKMLTIYPVDLGALRRTLEDLDDEVRAVGGRQSPGILSDVRWGAGPLHVRYGGFRVRHVVRADGTLAPAIEGPDGALIPDERRPVFTVPAGVPVPEFLAPHIAARRSRGDSANRYRVVRSLHFSNAGGVYLAETTDGRRVVLKEARPYAAVDHSGRDAVDRLRHEADVLGRLSGIEGIPALLDYFSAGEHDFLVEEWVPGPTLYQWQGAQWPLAVWDEPTPQQCRAYADRALSLLDRLDEVLERVHARGVVFGDLHPANVVVGGDDRPHLLDFEATHGPGDPGHPGLRAVGFAAGPHVVGIARDDYARAAVGLSMFLPLNRVLELEPAKLDQYLAFVAARFELPEGLLHRIGETLRAADAPTARPVLIGDCGRLDLPLSQADLTTAILASATPARADRLFPGAVSQFRTGGAGFAVGAGGVLWALAETTRQRHPEYEQWFVEAALKPPLHPGFYDGAHGLAYLCDYFDQRELALDLLDQASELDARIEAVGLRSGLAGAALNLSHFAVRTDDSRHLEAAVALAERIVSVLRTPGAGPRPGTAGLMHGWSGPALLFIRLFEAVGDPAYLAHAVEATHRDLDQCVRTASDRLQVDEPGVRTLSYLGVGSAGIALVIDELLTHVEDDRSMAALPALVRACVSNFTVLPGLFRGRAGLLIALARVAGRVAKENAVDLESQLTYLDLHAIAYGGGITVPGDQLMRLSMDVETGAAGVALAVHCVHTDAWAPLPFLSPRPAALSPPPTSADAGAPCRGDAVVAARSAGHRSGLISSP